MSSVVSRQQTKWSHVVFVNRDKNINDGYLNSMAKDNARRTLMYKTTVWTPSNQLWALLFEDKQQQLV